MGEETNRFSELFKSRQTSIDIFADIPTFNNLEQQKEYVAGRLYSLEADHRKQELRKEFIDLLGIVNATPLDQEKMLNGSRAYQKKREELEYILLPKLEKKIHNAVEKIYSGRENIIKQKTDILMAKEVELDKRETQLKASEDELIRLEKYVTGQAQAATQKEKAANELYRQAIKALNDAETAKAAAQKKSEPETKFVEIEPAPDVVEVVPEPPSGIDETLLDLGDLKKPVPRPPQ